MNSVIVTIVIPTYNRANVLPRAVNSVLAQTFQDFEIIIVDDCSKDNTVDVVRGFSDPRIKFIQHEQNKGGNATRNTGIKAAIGEFIAFLDSDDEWLPKKLEKQLPLFRNANVGLVYCGQKCFNEHTGQIFDFLHHKRGNVFYDMLTGNEVGSLSAVIVRSECIRKIDGMDEQLKSCQDWDLYIRLSKICQFDFVNECLINYYLGKKDPNRISNNRLSIISGHEAVQKKFEKEIQQLPVAFQLQHAVYLRNIYAVAGELGKVLKITFVYTLKSKSLSFLFSAPRVIGRSIKRNITKDYGY